MNNITSFISDHHIKDRTHKYGFIIHDIFIFVFYLMMLIQFNCRIRWLHKIIGIIITMIISPIMIITGIILSIKMERNSFLFLAYGLSYMIYNFDILRTSGIIKIYNYSIPHIIGFIIQLCSNFIMISQIYEENKNKDLELFSITYPLIILHFCEFYNRYRHKNYARFFLYVSSLGTLFSFVNMSYLSLNIKLIIYQVPLVLLIKNKK